MSIEVELRTALESGVKNGDNHVEVSDDGVTVEIDDLQESIEHGEPLPVRLWIPQSEDLDDVQAGVDAAFYYAFNYSHENYGNRARYERTETIKENDVFDGFVWLP